MTTSRDEGQLNHAWILICRACRAELSVPLTELEVDADPVKLVDGRDMLPAGCMWRARAGFVEFDPIATADILCCRRDLPTAILHDDTGCCGPCGHDGPNLRCVCGVDFATEYGDCWQPHVVCVHPQRVTCMPATAEVAVHVYASTPKHPSAWEFAGWVHEALGAQDWYGLDLDLLAQEWSARRVAPVVIVWLDAARDERAGVQAGVLIGRLAVEGLAVIAANTTASTGP